MTRPTTPRGSQWPPSGEGAGRVPAPNRSGWAAPHEDDGWGPSTAVYSSAAQQTARETPDPAQEAARSGGRAGRGFYPSSPARSDAPRPDAPSAGPDPWSPAGPRNAREQREVRSAERRTERSVRALQNRDAERGLPWWAALAALLAIAGVGGIIDTLGSLQAKGGFNIGIVVASVVAILAVKRSHMFPIVIAPPIVYSGAALCQLYVRSSGLHDHKVVLDAAANYLVYGFPAIAAATAAVLIIAGVRLISRK